MSLVYEKLNDDPNQVLFFFFFFFFYVRAYLGINSMKLKQMAKTI